MIGGIEVTKKAAKHRYYGGLDGRIGIIEVSNLILQTFERAAYLNGHEPHMNLEQMEICLYYAQGLSFVRRDIKLVPDPFYAKDGTIITQRVHKLYGEDLKRVMTREDVVRERNLEYRFTLDQQSVVFEAISVCEGKSVRKLRQMVRSMDAWQKAAKRTGHEINRREIKEDFLKMYPGASCSKADDLDYSALLEL